MAGRRKRSKEALDAIVAVKAGDEPDWFDELRSRQFDWVPNIGKCVLMLSAAWEEAEAIRQRKAAEGGVSQDEHVGASSDP